MIPKIYNSWALKKSHCQKCKPFEALYDAQDAPIHLRVAHGASHLSLSLEHRQDAKDRADDGNHTKVSVLRWWLVLQLTEDSLADLLEALWRLNLVSACTFHRICSVFIFARQAPAPDWRFRFA